MIYSRASIMRVMLQKQYAIFTRSHFDLNIVGIRSSNSKSNSFDDTLVVFFKDETGSWQTKQYPITTDPGKPYLLNPLKGTDGTLILVPGQYRAAYMLGIHGRSHKGGGYPALEQVQPMCYVRDKNRNDIIDFTLYLDQKNRFWGNQKTNIHRASKNFINRWVEVYSAGCQVFQKASDFDDFMYLCRLQIKHDRGMRFTYTLLEERDFKGLV